MATAVVWRHVQDRLPGAWSSWGPRAASASPARAHTWSRPCSLGLAIVLSENQREALLGRSQSLFDLVLYVAGPRPVILTGDVRFLTWPVTLWLKLSFKSMVSRCVRGGAFVGGGLSGGLSGCCAHRLSSGIAGAGSGGGHCSLPGCVGLSGEGASTVWQVAVFAAASPGALRTPRPS